MPTNRKRRSRSRTNDCPPELNMLFHIGSGMSHMNEDWVEDQWRQYGRCFMEKNPNSKPFALTVYGPPESIKDPGL